MEPMANRRGFLLRGAACTACAGLAAAAAGRAVAQSKVDESDENAVALGYRHDTTTVDSKKYPQHRPDQLCSNCQFWQGAKTDAWAGCSMFGRKQIANKGWCVAWKKV